MERFYEDLKDAQQRQKTAIERTERVSDAMRREQEKRLAQRPGGVEGFVKKQIERIERSVATLSEVPPAGRGAADAPMERAQSRLNDTRDMLAARDFDEALRLAREAQEGLEQAAMNAGAARSGARDAQSEAQKALRRAGQPVAEVVEDLMSLFPEPQQLMGAEERRAAQQLAEGQRDLQQRAQQLGQQMQRIGQQAPVFDPDMPGMLEQAGAQMGQAGRELGEGDPRAALPHERGALEQLGKLRESLEQMQQQGGGGGGMRGMPLPWAQQQPRGGGRGQDGRLGFRPDPVEIPSPEDYQAPKALREDILKAMKDPVPESYRPQVKRYYEELVK
jgi:hypothetical protein